jgi:hypothetical protein
MDKWQWHQWFAWYPVRLDDTGKYAWLRTIKRKQELNWGGSHWEYKE